MIMISKTVFIIHFINNYSEILCNNLENKFNFHLNNEKEILFIDRQLSLYRYYGESEDAINYLDEKLKTCDKKIKYDVYDYMFDIICMKNHDIEKIHYYIEKEKDKNLVKSLNELLKQYEKKLNEYID